MNAKDLAPEAIDCHVHAGLERQQSLEAVLRYCRDDGREVVGLLDHAELYMEHPPDWAAIGLQYAARRIAEVEALADMIDIYRDRLEGPELFYRHAREAIRFYGEGMRTAVGIEISGHSLEAGLVPAGWLDGADFIGICTTQPPVENGKRRPWGEHLAKLVSLADTLRCGRDMGLVLHHPFRWRLYEMARASSSTIPEAAGFTEEDARVTARALADAGAVAEANFASFYPSYIRQRVGGDRAQEVVAAARGAFVRLREAGAASAVKFSIGSDMHAVPGTLGIYRPSEMLEALGLTVGDLELPWRCEEGRAG